MDTLVTFRSAVDDEPLHVNPELVLTVNPREGGGATLHINNGCGMPPEELAVVESATDTETKLDEAWDETGRPYLERPWGQADS